MSYDDGEGPRSLILCNARAVCGALLVLEIILCATRATARNWSNPDDAKQATVEEYKKLTAQDIVTLSVFESLSTEQFNAIPDEALFALNDAQVAKISQERFNALGRRVNEYLNERNSVQLVCAGGQRWLLEVIDRSSVGYLPAECVSLLYQRRRLQLLREAVLAHITICQDDGDPTCAPELRTFLDAKASAYASDLDAKQISSLDASDLRTLRTAGLRAIRPALMANIKPEALARLSRQVLGTVTDEQWDALSSKQLQKLSAEQVRDHEHAFVRLRAAMKPGVRLLGDAYAQLASTAKAGGAFGAGLELIDFGDSRVDRCRWWSLGYIRASLVMRGGTSPSTLTKASELGAFLLTPDDQAVSFSGDLELAGPVVPELVLGGLLALRAARANLELTPDTPAASLFASSGYLGAIAGYIVGQGENYTEVALSIGYTVRAVNTRESYRTELLGGHSWFHGIGLLARLRINDVLIIGNVPIIMTDGSKVDGFVKGANFYVSMSLRTGAQLVDFAP